LCFCGQAGIEAAPLLHLASASFLAIPAHQQLPTNLTLRMRQALYVVLLAALQKMMMSN